jgi:MoxR-like ATPase
MLLDRKLKPAPVKSGLERVILDAGRIVLGKEPQIRMALACLVARGHLLIEDVPGVGKTTLSQVLAKLLGLEFQRIQFTSDLLPGDVLGVSIFDKETSAFRFHEGPVFSNVLLADEINRASPKAQSALLEAMEERQVTADGVSRLLPNPFFVIATQNPITQVGTFPLPESQLDRFLMRISLGYPDRAAERQLLKGEERRLLLDEVEPALPRDALRELQNEVKAVIVSDALIDYVQAIIEYSRGSQKFALGLSPRAGLALVRSAQAFAMISGRRHALPEDVQAVLGPVVGHRLHGAGDQARATFDVARDIIQNVAIP